MSRRKLYFFLPALIAFLAGAFFFNLHKRRFADEV